MFLKCTWIGDLRTSCHIANDNTRMYDITDINKSVQGISGNMKTTKQGKFHVKVQQVDGNEIVHTPWLVKYYERADTNLFYLNCGFSQ